MVAESDITLPRLVSRPELLAVDCDDWLNVWFAWGRLEHDFRLLDADCQTKVGAGFGEQVNHPLHVALGQCTKCAVVCKQQVTEDVKHDLTLSLLLLLIEPAVRGLSPFDSTTCSGMCMCF